jgi:hypothetical protein
VWLPAGSQSIRFIHVYAHCQGHFMDFDCVMPRGMKQYVYVYSNLFGGAVMPLNLFLPTCGMTAKLN